jgi:hypothetical protein
MALAQVPAFMQHQPQQQRRAGGAAALTLEGAYSAQVQVAAEATVLPVSGHMPAACVAWNLRQLTLTGQRGVTSGQPSTSATLAPLGALCPSLTSAHLSLLDPHQALDQLLATPQPHALSHLEVRLAGALGAPTHRVGAGLPGPGLMGTYDACGDTSSALQDALQAVQGLTGLASLCVSDGAGWVTDAVLGCALGPLVGLTSLKLDGCR